MDEQATAFLFLQVKHQFYALGTRATQQHLVAQVGDLFIHHDETFLPFVLRYTFTLLHGR